MEYRSLLIMSEPRNSTGRKSSEKTEMSLEKIHDVLLTLNANVMDMKNELSSVKFELTSVKNEITSVKNDITGLHDQVSSTKEFCKENQHSTDVLRSQLNDALKRIASLEEKSLQLETYSRRNNLIIEGIEDAANTSCLDQVRKFLHETMGIDLSGLSITDCHRVPITRKPYPIYCRFASYAHRQK